MPGVGKGTLGPEHRRLMRLLRDMRTEAGLTQVELAERLGKLQTEISKIERGERRVDFLDLARMLDALGVGLVRFAERWEQRSRTKPKR